MKAWRVNAKDGDYCTVVFAETRSKAKVAAMATDACEDAAYTEIECRRYPEADAAYRGVSEMEWDDDRDRTFLVKECGWSCAPEFAGDYCDTCPATEWCEVFKEQREEETSE